MTTKAMGINVALLLRVADVIAKHPEQFHMDQWDCGTTACIAGWAWRLARPDEDWWGARTGDLHPSTFLLGLKREQTGELFAEPGWPAEFRSRHCDTAAERADKAVRRIHAFLDEHAPGWRKEAKL
jgi:hypothetical protein